MRLLSPGRLANHCVTLARIASLFSNSTVLYSNSTRSSSRPKVSTSTRTASSLSSVFIVPTEPVGGFDGGNADATGAPTAPAPAATSTQPSPPSSGGLPPATQSAVIGGVVGGVAGIALVALVLMFLLKWKKGRSGGLLLLGDADSTAHGSGRRFPLGPNGGGDMAERSIPFAVSSTLASLAGQKRAIEPSPAEQPEEEKGFYRVSGKKLISVLESGGDGYSDPRDSIISSTSDYRQSQAFIGSSLQRLQLGSPMRPVSGVPIIRSGPNRTPVQAQGPFDNLRPLTPPTANQQGRSLTVRDETASQGSASRFAENT